MSFASRLSKLSRPSDMEDDQGSSEQVRRMKGRNPSSPQPDTDAGAEMSEQPDTSSDSAMSPQLGRIPGNAHSSGTRFGVGSPAAQPVASRSRMSFAQKIGQ